MNQSMPEEPVVRKRHLMVTFWLVYIFFSGISSVLSFVFFKSEVEKILQIEFSEELSRFLIIIGSINAVAAILLFLWKKIGFHFIIISNIISLYVNILMGASVLTCIVGLSQIAITYMILQMPQHNRTAWSWMK